MLDAFIREMVRMADQDGLPIERGALFRHMREWSEKTTDGNIGDATIAGGSTDSTTDAPRISCLFA